MENIKLKGVTYKTTLAELLAIVNDQRKKKKVAKKLIIETYYGKVVYFAAGVAAETATIIPVCENQQKMEVMKAMVATAISMIDKATIGQMCAMNATVINDGETTVYYW